MVKDVLPHPPCLHMCTNYPPRRRQVINDRLVFLSITVSRRSLFRIHVNAAAPCRAVLVRVNWIGPRVG